MLSEFFLLHLDKRRTSSAPRTGQGVLAEPVSFAQEAKFGGGKASPR